MKYPIMFLCRLVVILFGFFVLLPLYFLMFILFCIWDFEIKENWKRWKGEILGDFYEEDEENYGIKLYSKEKVYYYKTAWDYLINNKQYRNNPDYDPDLKKKYK